MNIFVLTGAGVSAESGLGTFRDKAGTGIWAKFDPMKLATPEAFEADPEEVHAFYNMRRRNLLQAEPNHGHFALARLEVTLPTESFYSALERFCTSRTVRLSGLLKVTASATSCCGMADHIGDAVNVGRASEVAGHGSAHLVVLLLIAGANFAGVLACSALLILLA